MIRGTTRSLCPICRTVVDADIVERDGRIYFAKRCPDHGAIEDFVCSDARWYDRTEFERPSRGPREFFTEAKKGCPLDCGLCPEHTQHTCVGLAEITSSCNLTCPMCYAGSAPGGTHWSFDTFRQVVSRFVRQEGEPDILQISGGEPTIHPEFMRFVRHAVEQPIQVVMVNTNGLRLARDPALVEALAPLRNRLEVYLQFDGFDDRTSAALRGESLVETKLRALDALVEHGIRTTLVCTVHDNLDQVGPILKYGLERPWVRGVSFQPATFSGRHPALERRATIPDVVKALAAQVGWLAEDDFMPLPCAHPNCHAICYVYRDGPTPVNRLIDVRNNLDFVADTLVYTPDRARKLVERICCGPSG